jgi:hypothetical protein
MAKGGSVEIHSGAPDPADHGWGPAELQARLSVLLVKKEEIESEIDWCKKRIMDFNYGRDPRAAEEEKKRKRKEEEDDFKAEETDEEKEKERKKEKEKKEEEAQTVAQKFSEKPLYGYSLVVMKKEEVVMKEETQNPGPDLKKRRTEEQLFQDELMRIVNDGKQRENREQGVLKKFDWTYLDREKKRKTVKTED